MRTAMIVVLFCVGCFLPSWPSYENLSKMTDRDVANKLAMGRYYNDSAIMQRCRAVFIDRNEGWDDNTKTLIMRGAIWIGMSEDQLIASWGLANDVTRYVGPFGVVRTYRFDRLITEYPRRNHTEYDIVVTENNRVTSWVID